MGGVFGWQGVASLQSLHNHCLFEFLEEAILSTRWRWRCNPPLSASPPFLSSAMSRSIVVVIGLFMALVSPVDIIFLVLRRPRRPLLRGSLQVPPVPLVLLWSPIQCVIFIVAKPCRFYHQMLSSIIISVLMIKTYQGVEGVEPSWAGLPCWEPLLEAARSLSLTLKQ